MGEPKDEQDLSAYLSTLAGVNGEEAMTDEPKPYTLEEFGKGGLLLRCPTDSRVRATVAALESERAELAKAREKAEALAKALEGLKHREVNGRPCWCFLWPDEPSKCEGSVHCLGAQSALRDWRGGGA